VRSFEYPSISSFPKTLEFLACRVYFPSFKFFITFIYVGEENRVVWRSKDNWQESALHHVESQRLKSDHGAWRQVPLPTEPPCWAHFPRHHLSSGKSRLPSKYSMTSTCGYSSAAHGSASKQRERTLGSNLPYPQPGTDSARQRGWGRGCSAAGWWRSLPPQSSFPDQLRKHFHVGPKFLFPVPSHTIFRPSRHFLCWPVPPTSGLSWLLLSGCLQGGPDTRDSPRRDPGVPGNRLVPSRWPAAANSHLVPPTQRKTCCFRVGPSLRPETLLSLCSHQDTQVLQGLPKNGQWHFRPEGWLLSSDILVLLP
jgi:hypothetical protein